MAPNPAFYSTMVRAGRTTYFIDLKEAKNGNKYLNITQSSIDGEKTEKLTVRVFQDQIGDFQKAIADAVAAIPTT